MTTMLFSSSGQHALGILVFHDEYRCRSKRTRPKTTPIIQTPLIPVLIYQLSGRPFNWQLGPHGPSSPLADI